MLNKSFSMTLQWAKEVAPGVRQFAFARDDGEILSYIPGQFITLYIETADGITRRSYSIAAPPGSGETIDFAASYVEGGLASELLFNLEPGDKVTAGGPFGRLVLRDEQPKRYILAATGTGVTPYRAMLPSLKQRLAQEPLEVVLLLGVQHRADLLYGQDFIDFAKAQPNFEFRAQFSREAAEDLSEAHEHAGYVQAGLAEIAPNPEQDIVYLCGNPGMIDESYAMLQTLGFDIKTVRREKYISSK